MCIPTRALQTNVYVYKIQGKYMLCTIHYVNEVFSRIMKYLDV